MRVNVFELAYRYVYPSVRRRLVQILYLNFGLKQMEISRLLGLTQSAVSRYITSSRGVFVDISRFGDIDQAIKKLAAEIVNNGLDKYTVQYELARITLKALGQGYLCGFHRKLEEDVDLRKCRTCLNLFRTFIY